MPFLITSPEKALCDTIIHTSGLTLRSAKAMEEYLVDHLRFDMEALRQFNVSIIEVCGCWQKKSRITEPDKTDPEMTMFGEMMFRYAITAEIERQSALHEVMQQVTLAGLYSRGFFEKAVD